MKLLSCENFTGRLREICEGSDEGGNPIDLSPEKRLKYLKTLFPEEEEEVLINHLQTQTVVPGTKFKLGSIIATGIKLATLGLVKPCAPCKKREEWLNEIEWKKIFNLDIPSEVNFQTERNLIMHIWPTHNGAWKWNLDQLISRKEVFTGKVVIGIAEGPVSSQEVIDYVKPLNAETFVVPNNPRIREGATFLRLLESVKDSPDSITFFCHSKGARHKTAFLDPGSTLHLWNDVMYRACLDNLDLVITQLRSSAMTGAFRRFGQFTTPGNNRWHYSGAFYWFRNRDVFERSWQKMDKFFFAVESWPGLMFKSEETACCFHDNCGDLYLMNYWESVVVPKLTELGAVE